MEFVSTEDTRDPRWSTDAPDRRRRDEHATILFFSPRLVRVVLSGLKPDQYLFPVVPVVGDDVYMHRLFVYAADTRYWLNVRARLEQTFLKENFSDFIVALRTSRPESRFPTEFRSPLLKFVKLREKIAKHLNADK